MNITSIQTRVWMRTSRALNYRDYLITSPRSWNIRRRWRWDRSNLGRRMKREECSLRNSVMLSKRGKVHFRKNRKFIPWSLFQLRRDLIASNTPSPIVNLLPNPISITKPQMQGLNCWFLPSNPNKNNNLNPKRTRNPLCWTNNQLTRMKKRRARSVTDSKNGIS